MTRTRRIAGAARHPRAPPRWALPRRVPSASCYGRAATGVLGGTLGSCAVGPASRTAGRTGQRRLRVDPVPVDKDDARSWRDLRPTLARSVPELTKYLRE